MDKPVFSNIAALTVEKHIWESWAHRQPLIADIAAELSRVYDLGVAAERERCARLVDAGRFSFERCSLADAIRAPAVTETGEGK